MMGKFKMMETKESWIKQLVSEKYKRFNNFTKVESTKQIDENEDSNKDYNYLLSMPIWSFCHEKVVEIEANLIANKKLLETYENMK